jgi:hypothetical protein
MNRINNITKSTFLSFLAISIVGSLLLLGAIFKAFASLAINPASSFSAAPQTMLVSFILLPIWGLFCGANLYVSYLFVRAAPKIMMDLYGEGDQCALRSAASRKWGHILLIALPSLGICLCLWRLIII